MTNLTHLTRGDYTTPLFSHELRLAYKRLGEGGGGICPGPLLKQERVWERGPKNKVHATNLSIKIQCSKSLARECSVLPFLSDFKNVPRKHKGIPQFWDHFLG